ncbi:helix-turn-helix domain-containing protein [Bacillus thuringiensis]|nr:helix-turn-helix domain-containing protein [Bacillus thuringiensis]
MSVDIIKHLIEGDTLKAVNDEIQFTKDQLDETAKDITARYKKKGEGQPLYDKSVKIPKKEKPENESVTSEGNNEPKDKHPLTFIKMPMNLRYYSYMIDYGIKDSAILMYEMIIDFYNKEKRCAFPSQYTLAMHTGKSVRSVVSTLKALREVGLIEVRKRSGGSNNEYRPLLPLPPEELFKRYPRALKRLIEHNAKVSALRERDYERKQEKKDAGEWK